MSRTRPSMPCRSCTHVGPTRGRGLCRPCYDRHSDAGTLDQFESLDTRITGKPARPFRDCPWCERTHRGATESCVDCEHLEDGLDEIPSREDALAGGQWAVVHGVRRWVPDHQEESTAA